MSDVLTPEVLAELRGVLEAKRASLETDLAALQNGEDNEAEFNSRADVVGDSADSSVDLQEIDDDHTDADALRRDLAEVQHALAKFDDGTYGLCEAGDGPIPVGRLRIIPEARYDAKHQAEAEARQAQP